MTVNSYLTNIANNAIIRDTEKQSIDRSIATLQTRLNSFFSNELSQHLLFGSFTRGTILPRKMDSHSDIDYMIIFNDSGYQPQTYLNKLNRFANNFYSTSEIFQSNPTIVLSLNHINFELVPATRSWLYGLQIPAKASSSNTWINTNPNDFNDILTSANKNNQNMIKPVIRLIKYWNAKNNYPFESFELEQMLALKSYQYVGGFFGTSLLKDYFFEAMESLYTEWFAPQYKIDAVKRAHKLITDIKYYLRNNQETDAEIIIQQLIPNI